MLGRIKDKVRILTGNWRGGKIKSIVNPTPTVRSEPRGIAEEDFAVLVMDQYDIIKSEIGAKGEHKDEMEACSHCRMSAAIHASSRYQVAHHIMMSNLFDEAPFAALVMQEVSQAVFDAFMLGVIITKAATIAAVERGDIEVWKSKDKGTPVTEV